MPKTYTTADTEHAVGLMPEHDPFYRTRSGATFLGDSSELMRSLPAESVDLICTSPPFPLLRPKAYGNRTAAEYLEWFHPFAAQFKRVLKDTGSVVIDLGGTWLRGRPVRSLYQYQFVIEMCTPEEEGGLGFRLAQDLYWYNDAKLPTPAAWVTVRRCRLKDAVNTVWWLSKTDEPTAHNSRVLQPYSDSHKRLLKKGYNAGSRPSEHFISEGGFSTDNGGAIPPTLLVAANTSSNDQYLSRCRSAGLKAHPARFPESLPDFAIKLCTNQGDLVLDPFCGSNTTGSVAERLGRRHIGMELEKEYLDTSRFRFNWDDDE